MGSDGEGTERRAAPGLGPAALRRSAGQAPNAAGPPPLDGLAQQVMAHTNLGTTVYAAICEALISGHFRSGDPVRIRDLAAGIGTSVTPVRDAVLRLVQDEALTMKSARDIRVAPISVPVYTEIRDIRLQLEAMAAANAADLATPEQIAGLHDLLAQQAAANDAVDHARTTALNQRFHFALAELARMPVLHGTLRRLWLRMGPLIAAVHADGGLSMVDRHYDVVAALERRDSKAAAAAIREDITLGGRAILDWLEAEQGGDGGAAGGR